MDNNSYIKSASPFFDKKSINDILMEIESTLKGGILTNGFHVKNFERNFAQYINVKHAIAVNSGTSALEIPMKYYKLKGKEVIVPTNTFVATPNSVIFAGGKPVFADIREDTLCIDPKDLQERITNKTIGVIVVHLDGLICPQIDEIKEICKDNQLFLIEDSAHAHGAEINGVKAGTLGDVGAFSFYPTKIMTSGEGGIITTNNSKIAEAARYMRNQGLNKIQLMIMIGHNWRMSEITAIIANNQLKNIEKFLSKRNNIAKKYEEKLSHINEISLFKTPKNIRHSYYKYPIKILNELDVEKLLHLLYKYNIEIGNSYYPPCHLHPYYKKNFGTKKGDLSVSENILKKVICLPIHFKLTTKKINYILEKLKISINVLKNE